MSQLSVFLVLVLTIINATGLSVDSSHVRGDRQMWRGQGQGQGQGSVSRVSHARPSNSFRQTNSIASPQRQDPKPPASICNAAGFFANPESCTDFHRCVDWTGKNIRFSIFHFTCPAGTIFDNSLGICNHPWAVKRPECTGYQEPIVIPSTQEPVSIGTQKPTQATTIGSGTGSPGSSETTGSTQSLVNGISTQEGTNTDNSTQTGVQIGDSSKGDGSSQTDIQTGGSSQTEISITTSTLWQEISFPGVTSPPSGSSIQTDAPWQEISFPGVTSDPSESIQSGDGQTDSSYQTSSPDSMVSVQTVTLPTDGSSQTDNPSQSNSSSQTDSSSQSDSSSQTDSSQTVSTLSTENPLDTDFTTVNPSSISSYTSPASPSSTLPPQTNSTGPPKPFTLECKQNNKYSRHPLYCNRYYYCIWDSDTADWTFPSFTCPRDLLFDEYSQQCSNSAASCDGILAPSPPTDLITSGTQKPTGPTTVTTWQTPSATSEDPVTTDFMGIPTSTETNGEVDPVSSYSCPAPGYYPFEGDCIRFYKCVETEEGKLKGLLYRCPNGYGYNENMQRCRKEQELPKCEKFMTEALFRVEAARPLYVEDLKWFFVN